MKTVVDYSGRPSPAAIVAAGHVGVARYLWPLKPKGIDAGEANGLLGAALIIFLFFEAGAADIAGGANWGHQAGIAAANLLTSLGTPLWVPIFYAADYPAPEQDWPAIAAALDAAAPTSGHPSAIYGRAQLVERMILDGHASHGIETAGWSGGYRSPYALLHQRGGFELDQQTVIDGVWCDVSDVNPSLGGQFGAAGWSEPRRENGSWWLW